MIGLFSKRDREKHKIPRSIQDCIPIDRIWDNGICEVDKNKYSYTYKFTDINYYVASKEDKESMFLSYSELLNSFDPISECKITINLKKINKKDFEKEILLPFKEDGLDIYRKEYNDMLLDKAFNSNGMVKELYLTITTIKKDYEEAKNYFRRIGTELSSYFSKLGCKCSNIDANEKLRILHDVYRIGEEAFYNFDISNARKLGHSFKDYICPDSFSFKDDYFEMGDKFGRVLFLKDYANFIRDSMVSDLTDINQNMMISIDIKAIPINEAVKMLERILLGVESNITNWQRKQNANNNFSAVIPYDMEQSRNEARETLHDVTSRDQMLFEGSLTILLISDSKEKLDEISANLKSIGQRHLCQITNLKYQQLYGLNTVLPIGKKRIKVSRTLTTESLAALMPFKVQEIMDEKGIYYGENAISNNLIMVDKSKLLNQSAFLLGVPGSGKSFSAKELITFLALSTDDDILICDPESEYTPLVEALHGEAINISSTSNNHINAMMLEEGYGEGNPIAAKSEFILSLFEELLKKHGSGLGPIDKSIIDRCISIVYENFKGKENPTLLDLKKTLNEQPEEEAHNLALCLEIYSEGSLDIFAHQTNVNTNNRIISYDIHKLGQSLKTFGLLVITDAILNRVNQNYKKGKRTHIFIDEFHVMFKNEYSANFFNSVWRQFRKRNAYPTAITQNVEYLLSNVEASTMLSNSEFIVMLNQAHNDRQQLAELLNISEEQLSYIKDSDAGCGLIRYGSSLVPFKNHFPENTRLYKLMTTKPGE